LAKLCFEPVNHELLRFGLLAIQSGRFDRIVPPAQSLAGEFIVSIANRRFRLRQCLPRQLFLMRCLGGNAIALCHNLDQL
jgi:hypothetical protein